MQYRSCFIRYKIFAAGEAADPTTLFQSIIMNSKFITFPVRVGLLQLKIGTHSSSLLGRGFGRFGRGFGDFGRGFDQNGRGFVGGLKEMG
jgi:hypothetical protein